MRPDNNLFKKFFKKGAAVITAMALMTTMSAINARSVDESWFEEFEGIQIQVVSIWGDANYDNVLGSDDASQVLSTYAKNATGLASGYNGREDVNFDGIANSVDASLILEQYAKVSTGRLEKLLDQGGVFIELPYGRTFSGIAVEEGMSMAELQKLNPELENINNLSAGQKIYVMRRPFFFEEEEENVTTTSKEITTTHPITTTKKATTGKSTQNVTTTTKPITNVQVIAIEEFENGHIYMLSDEANSWTLYNDKSLSNIVRYLGKDELIQVEFTEVSNLFKGRIDGDEYYFTVKPENRSKFYKVVDSSSITEKTTTVAKPTTAAKKYYANPYIPWNIRAEASTSSSKIGELPYLGVYEVLSTSAGWEKISYNGLVGFIYVADYPENFQVYTVTSTTTVAKPVTTANPIVNKTKVYIGDVSWNIRSDATTNSEIIATIPSGGKYTCSAITTDGWEKVSYNGISGWLGTSGYEELFVDADKVPVTTTPVVVPSEGAFPESVLSVIRSVQSQYLNAKISASAYDLSGRRGYTYNGYTPLYAGCSLKAAYATYVLKQCEARGIDISKYCLEYREGMKNTGAGDLQYSEYGTMFSVGYLIDKLIIISDNTAYNILLSEFPMWEYKQWLNTIGGQQNIAAPYQLYGSASSKERVNEWVHVWNYIQSGTAYANRLRYNLSVASPNFLGANVYHKSGSCDQWDYTCASDAGVVNGRYILAIVVQDAESENGSANAVRLISNAIRSWVAANGIF